jgi:hypothetical protein
MSLGEFRCEQQKQGGIHAAAPVIFGYLFLGLFFFLDAEALVEAVNTATGIHQFLSAGKKRMAF